MMELKNKHIAILGAVRSGIGAAKLIKKLGGVPFISDFSAREKLTGQIKMIEDLDIEYETGGHSERVYNSDFIVTSPGVPTNSPVILSAVQKGIKVISELELAASNCNGKIIAITGTNGKTTTTNLFAHTLNACGIKTYLAGNIGLAFSEIALDVKKDEFVALEVSSFQLDFIDKFKPFISVILNITPDHLDRYDLDFNLYKAAKAEIFKNQDQNDYYIFNLDDKNTPDGKSNKSVKKIAFSTIEELGLGVSLITGYFYFNDKKLFPADSLNIPGIHNISNSMPVLAVSELLDLDIACVENAFLSFPGVEHRLEFVAKKRGRKFINDSKATNVESVWYALQSFDNPIYLILGGKDKGNDYGRIEDLVLTYVEKIYAIGSSKDKIRNYFKELIEVEEFESLKDAVIKAYEDSTDDGVVLLSPACASFDMFDNYEHRGKVFKQIVKEIKE